MSTCYDCGKEVQDGIFRCEDCLELITEASSQEKRRRSLTDYEELKLKFYHSNKFWENNIRSRKTTTNRKGEKVVTYVNNRNQEVIMPQQPRQYWPEPKRR